MHPAPTDRNYLNRQQKYNLQQFATSVLWLYLPRLLRVLYLYLPQTMNFNTVVKVLIKHIYTHNTTMVF